ncbi:MAG: glycosyltransferase [Caldilineaceae bacterium]
MKILLTGQAFYRCDNGQAVFTINLAEGLAASGQQVMVLAPSTKRPAAREQQNGVTVQTVPAFSLFDNTNVTAFSGGLVNAVFEQFQPDVVHIQDHYFLSRAVLRAARTRHILTVGTNHFLPENLTDNLLRGHPLLRGVQPLANRLLWRNMLGVYNRLAAVSTPTQTAAAILRAQAIRSPVSAISCGVDVQRFRPRPTLDRSFMRRKYGLAPDKPVLLYVGRIDREKKLDLLIAALAQMGRADMQLAIAGKGAFRPKLEQLCAELGLRDQVVFTGFVPDADLPLLLNSVDIFAMPSHAELQSIATLEAMASGLPVLAANARALPELVTPGSNGQLFDPTASRDAAQAIAQLIAQRRQWPQMGAISRAKAECHAHSQVVTRYVQWYCQTDSRARSASIASQTPCGGAVMAPGQVESK